MSEPWPAAVEEAADTLGELLIEMAGGSDYTPEDLAARTLHRGLVVLLGDRPSEKRVTAAARTFYQTLHHDAGSRWSDLSDLEKTFWTDVAAAALAAGDRALLEAVDDGLSGAGNRKSAAEPE